MDKEAFYKWLETCPTGDWEVIFELENPNADYVQVTFKLMEDDDAT